MSFAPFGQPATSILRFCKLYSGQHPRGDLMLGVVSIGLLAGVVFFPLFGAALHTDDWGWLALARHSESPWASFVRPLIFGYFYRPTTFVVWFVTERWWGYEALPHYLFNIALHVGASLTLVGWLLAAGIGRLWAWWAGACFVAHPAISGTALWLSSRNELLAVLFGLIALWLSVQPLRWRLVLTSLCLFVAVSSKETGLIFVLAVGLNLWFSAGWRVAFSLWAIISILAPVIFAVIMRLLVVVPIGPEANARETLPILAEGIRWWWTHWSWALGVTSITSSGAFKIWASVGATAVVATAAIRCNRSVAIAGLSLLFFPAVLQSPITAQVLSHSNALDHLVNLRFFCTASLGGIILLCLAGQFVSRLNHSLAAAAGSLLIVFWLVTSQMQTSQWKQETLGMDRQLSLLLPGLTRVPNQIPGGCVLNWPGKEIVPELARFGDPYIKAHLDKGVPAARCVVAIDGLMPYYSILGEHECDPAEWTAVGWSVRYEKGKAMADQLGTACQLVLMRPVASPLPKTLSLYP